MDKYMNMAIKTVITEFPRVGTILNDYGIGCVSCSVGTCLMKDIIEIHNVPKDVEVEMMKKIEAAINNKEITASAQPVLSTNLSPGAITYAEPIQKLVDEHTVIKQFLAFVPELCTRIESDFHSNKELVLQGVEFIKQFADKFHHAKEEDILFAYAKGNTDIINVMLEDHKKGRYYVKSMLLGLEMEDPSFVVYSLKHYKELLTEHIKKEDEILYPWIQKSMNDIQLKDLELRFIETDASFGVGFYERWMGFAHRLNS